MFERPINSRDAVSIALLATLPVACSAETDSMPPLSGRIESSLTSAPKPTNLRAIVGGYNIALRWSIDQPAEARSYKIWKDGRDIWVGLVNGNPSLVFFDNHVTRGATYEYRVEVIDVNGSSQSSPTVIATHPESPFPTPTIYIDDREAPALRPFLEEGKKFLQIWYPKLVENLSLPERRPIDKILIRAVREPKEGDSDYDPLRSRCLGAGWVDTGVSIINVCDSMASSQSFDLFGHEATHIFQEYVDSPGLLWEGIATWAGDLSGGITRPPVDKSRTYMNGYEDGATFLAWVSEHYELPNLVPRFSQKAQLEPFRYSWFTTETGHQVNELWEAMTKVKLSLPNQLRSRAPNSLCAWAVKAHMENIYDPELKPESVSPIELHRCQQAEGNTWVYEPVAGRLHVSAHCAAAMDTNQVVYARCNGTESQRWEYTGQSWRNVRTQRCLAPGGSATQAGTPLVTAPCDDTPEKRWYSFQF